MRSTRWGRGIDTVTAQTEYYVQTPLAVRGQGRYGRCRTICRIPPCWTALGSDARWAIVCTQLSHRLQAAGGTDNPRFSAAVRRMERALYYDYELGDDSTRIVNIEIKYALDRML